MDKEESFSSVVVSHVVLKSVVSPDSSDESSSVLDVEFESGSVDGDLSHAVMIVQHCAARINEPSFM